MNQFNCDDDGLVHIIYETPEHQPIIITECDLTLLEVTGHPSRT